MNLAPDLLGRDDLPAMARVGVPSVVIAAGTIPNRDTQVRRPISNAAFRSPASRTKLALGTRCTLSRRARCRGAMNFELARLPVASDDRRIVSLIPTRDTESNDA